MVGASEWAESSSLARRRKTVIIGGLGGTKPVRSLSTGHNDRRKPAVRLVKTKRPHHIFPLSVSSRAAAACPWCCLLHMRETRGGLSIRPENITLRVEPSRILPTAVRLDDNTGSMSSPFPFYDAPLQTSSWQWKCFSRRQHGRMRPVMYGAHGTMP